MHSPVKLSQFQSEVIQRFEDTPKRHLLCSAPTGSGKGVIMEEILRNFQRPAVIFVPLSALGRQTADRLRTAGVNAHFLEGPLRLNPQVLVLNPERLETSAFKQWLTSNDPEMVFIDECHFLEDWGSGFRPRLKAVYTFLKEVSPRKTLWMSGTLPRFSFESIQKETGLHFDVIGKFRLSVNLSIDIRRMNPAIRFEYVEKTVLDGSGFKILFCNTRKETEKWARLCRQKAVDCAFYHAGLSREERVSMEAQLLSDPKSVLFATSAFGMGMDFNYLEWSVLTSAPFSLLALVQGLGRAGRGFKIGRGSVLWAESDFRWNSQLLKRKSELEDLRILREYLEETSPEAKADFLSAYFV